MQYTLADIASRWVTGLGAGPWLKREDHSAVDAVTTPRIKVSCCTFIPMPVTRGQSAAGLPRVIFWRAQVIRAGVAHLKGEGGHWLEGIQGQRSSVWSQRWRWLWCWSAAGMMLLRCTLFYTLLWCTAGTFCTDKEVFTAYHTITQLEGSGGLMKQSVLMIQCAAFHNQLLILHFLHLSVRFAIFGINSTSALRRLLFTAGSLCFDACCHVKRLCWQCCRCLRCCQAETRASSFIKRGRWTLITPVRLDLRLVPVTVTERTRPNVAEATLNLRCGSPPPFTSCREAANAALTSIGVTDSSFVLYSGVFVCED